MRAQLVAFIGKALAGSASVAYANTWIKIVHGSDTKASTSLNLNIKVLSKLGAL